MIAWLLGGLAVHFAQCLLPTLFRYFLRPDPRLWEEVGPRDNPPETSVQGRRSERALANGIEGMVPFIALALLLIVVPGDADRGLPGAQLFVVCRFLYAGIYIAGIPVLRSIVWTVGHLGLLLMALSI